MSRSRRPHAIWTVTVVLCSSATFAHPPGKKGHQHHHPHGDDETSEVVIIPEDAQLPPGLVLPALDGAKPWTDKPIFDDPDRFQIAIMTDNTGGHRPGIWMKAVEKINLLRPTFVMSVGDLIEGYPESRERVEAEWQEFLGFMDKMEMRFFFVAGNHDLKDPLMHQIWREHFGPEYYSFDYKGVHFVALCSEDPVTKLGDAQIEWLTKDLEQAKDARWTLLFLHKPLWVTAEREIAAGNPDSTNWKKVEQLLGERPHTVFSGHVHYYAQYDRNGQKYYHLATTGGSSLLRGIEYGEFDEVAWLTMEKDGPTVANLVLDGILPGDVVTEEGYARFSEFLEKTQIEVAPILIDDEDGISQGRIDLRLNNGFEVPVELNATIAGLPLRGLTVDPESLKLAAAPGQSAELAVNVQFNEKITFDHLAHSVLTASIRTTEGDRPLSAEREIPIIIDRKYPVPVLANSEAPFHPGFSNWPNRWLSMPGRPLVLDRAQDWTGPDDCSIAIQAARDDRYLFIAAKVTDERLIDGDNLTILVDARPLAQRRDDPRLRKGAYRITLNPRSSEYEVVALGKSAEPNESSVHWDKGTSGYNVGLALSLDAITAHQPDWRSIQLTAVVSDVDESGQPPARVLWRGTSDVDERNTNFGHFVQAP